MKQTTVKTAIEALAWIEATPHHVASAEEEGFFVLKGRDRKCRIPVAVLATMQGLYEPGGENDRRMYRATRKGRRLIEKGRRLG